MESVLTRKLGRGSREKSVIAVKHIDFFKYQNSVLLAIES
jgi:hypothetical protein